MVKTGVKTNPLLFPGQFLYSYYLDSAFYVPLYLLACSFFLVRKKFHRDNVILLILTILPFLTTGLALRLHFLPLEAGRFEKALLKSFGQFAPVVVFLIALIEVMLIIKAGFYLSARRGPDALPGGEKSLTDEIPSDEYVNKSGVEGNTDSGITGSPAGTADVSRKSGFASLSLSGISSNREKMPVGDELFDEPAYFRVNREEKGPAPDSTEQEDVFTEAETGEENSNEAEYADVFPEDEPYNGETGMYPDDIPPETIYASAKPLQVEIPEEMENEEIIEAEIDASIEENPSIVKEYFSAQKKIIIKKKEYKIPFDILDEYREVGYTSIDARTRDEAEILRQTLAEFRIEAEVTGIRKGPVITMFEILPAPGVKLSRITNLADNIALRLAASRVRIVAPIPGKHAVGIEVPNRNRAIVSFRELIAVDYPQYTKYHLPIILGKDITGEEQIIDLTQTPHLLIAGATGSGKSVCVNSIIASLLYTKKPQDVKLILIDPKIVELKLYNDIPHLLTPVITDPKKAFQALQYCIFEMEKRYALLDALGVRDIHSFNRKIKSKNIATLPLPYIVVVVDEFADLMATTGKELESTLARLAAMSRAVGIHLVLATQRPSIDVITGLIKANIPSRIAFMVASKTDSRIIIDSVGAEMLLGKGDMLFTSAWNPYLTRIQGAYLSESEAEKVVEKVREYGAPEYIDDEIFIDDDEDDLSDYENDYGDDPLMDRALEIVATAGKASASYLQRRLKIGYNRAARLVEEMERRGIVGPQNGSKPRDILNIPDKL
ncbi:MAG: DNA translocase FtsK [Spirochaetales bacterium]|nr:DNA translocase FtsK [Spirochaetales bacterium]